METVDRFEISPDNIESLMFSSRSQRTCFYSSSNLSLDCESCEGFIGAVFASVAGAKFLDLGSIISFLIFPFGGIMSKILICEDRKISRR